MRSRRFLQNTKPHSSLPKASFGKTTNILRESKGCDTAGLGMSKQFDTYRVNARLPVSIWLTSEMSEEGPGVEELRNTENRFQSFDFFQGIQMK